MLLWKAQNGGKRFYAGPAVFSSNHGPHYVGHDAKFLITRWGTFLNAKATFRRLERQRTATVRDLRSLSQEQLQTRPAPDSWSALEVLDHLIRSERAVLRSMRENMGHNHEATIQERLRNGIVTVMMLLPTRLRIPGSVSFLAPQTGGGDLQLLAEAWTAERASLSLFLESLSPDDERKGLFRHPVGGWTTASGALCFLQAHFVHHTYQLSRLKRALHQGRTT